MSEESVDASDFTQVRVLTFHKWSHPMFEAGITHEVMAMAMYDMANDFEKFKQLKNEETGLCFIERCTRITDSLYDIGRVVEFIDNLPLRARVSALNMFSVLADQIGRLTLHGYTEEDEFSVMMREKAKSETYRWHLRFSDPECEPIQKTLLGYLEYLHFFLAGCTCYNCKWEYQLQSELR
jgi:hypothetical protein